MNNDPEVKVLIIDDHQILLDGVKKLLFQSRFKVVAEAVNRTEAMAVLLNSKIDIVICDISIPDINSGISLIEEIRKKFPKTKIVVLTMHDERSIVHDVISLGIDAYLLKNINMSQLIEALERVSINKFYISEEISDCLLEKFRNTAKPILSDRESEILKLIIREYSTKKIAEELYISDRTVETHRKNIYRKTNTTNIVGLIKYAIENKLV